MNLEVAKQYYSYDNPEFKKIILKFLNEYIKLYRFSDKIEYEKKIQYYRRLIKDISKLNELDYQDIFYGIIDLLNENINKNKTYYIVTYYGKNNSIIRKDQIKTINKQGVEELAEYYMKKYYADGYDIREIKKDENEFFLSLNKLNLFMAIMFLYSNFDIEYENEYDSFENNEHLKKTEYQILLGYNKINRALEIEDILTDEAKKALEPFFVGKDLNLFDNYHSVLEAKKVKDELFYSFDNKKVIDILEKIVNAIIFDLSENDERDIDSNMRRELVQARKILEKIINKKTINNHDVKFIYDEINDRLFNSLDPEEVIELTSKEAYLLYAVYYLNGFEYYFNGYLDDIKDNPHIHSTEYQILLAKKSIKQFNNIKDFITPEAYKEVGHIVSGLDLGLLEKGEFKILKFSKI